MINGSNVIGLINSAMRIGTKQVARLILPVMFLGMLLLAACENDLSKIKEISAQQISQPIETTTGVEVTYSDSAKVKGKLITPLWIHHTIDSPYYVMPKGVKVIFYDKFLKESGNIVSDSAVQREKQNITEFYKNVVGTNAKGDTFKSDELIWDQDKKIVYSNKPVLITTKSGDVQNSTSFKSNEDFSNSTFGNATGYADISDSGLQ